MKKKKKKFRFLKFLIIIILLGVILFFVNKQFNLLERFSIGNIIKEVEIPKLKIIDEDSNTRPVAVMINNLSVARPHSGLQDAFLNYEIIVEGGITRILSIFKDKDTERIGSIRSARHYFLDYALENDAIYVHFGHSPQALNDIDSLNIDSLNGMYISSLYWRDRSLNVASEHTAFTSIEKIMSSAKNKKYRITSEESPLLNYDPYPVNLASKEGATKADKVTIEYSSYTTTMYEYDKATGLYKRYTKGTAHTDYVTKEQYTTKNIITYQVKNELMGSKGRQTIYNTGTGTGYYITNGYAIPITWEKPSRSEKTIYKYKDGTIIDVNDGVTWIQIQPVGKKLSIEANEETSSNNN